MTEQPLHLETEDGLLYATWHESEVTPSRGTIVFCHPIFEEKKSAHRTLVETARAFSSSGFACLRFDYSGCGDSAGDLDTVSLATWQRNVQAALQWAQARSDMPLGLLGLRFGGALAIAAAEQNPSVTWLVLWEPVLDGRTYLQADLRKKVVREMMRRGQAASTRERQSTDLARDGMIDFDGYLLTAGLHAELSAMDLAERPKCFAGDLLLLQIAPIDTVRPAMQRFLEGYHRTRTRNVHALKAQPFWNLIGITDTTDVIQATRNWLCGHIRCGEAG